MTLRRFYQIARERDYALMLSGPSPALRTRFARLGLPLASVGVAEQATKDLALHLPKPGYWRPLSRAHGDRGSRVGDYVSSLIAHVLAGKLAATTRQQAQ
jgi:hypothetical protein